MGFPWGILVVLVGIAYGYFTPGRQSKMQILKKGLLWGLVVAIVTLYGWGFSHTH